MTETSILLHAIVVIFIMVMLSVIGMLLAFYHRDTSHRIPDHQRLLNKRDCDKCDSMDIDTITDTFEQSVCESDFVMLIKLESDYDDSSENHWNELKMIRLRSFRTKFKLEPSAQRHLYLNSSIDCMTTPMTANREYLVAGHLRDIPQNDSKTVKMRPKLTLTSCDLIIDWSSLTVHDRTDYIDVLTVINDVCGQLIAINNRN